MTPFGRILYNKGNIIINSTVLALKPYSLITFSTRDNSSVERVKLSRKLQRYVKKYSDGSKHIKGLIDNETIIGTGKGFLLVRHNKKLQVEKLLNKYNVKYRIVDRVYK